MLRVENLTVQAHERLVLKGVSVELAAGQLVALVGPNGSGKSSFTKALLGHPAYKVVEGQIWLKDPLGQWQQITTWLTHERARAGLFVAFQNPVEISGLKTLSLIQQTVNTVGESQGFPPLELPELRQMINSWQVEWGNLVLPESFWERDFNVSFSGGEKKKVEWLQAMVWQPRILILDEIDSGLDWASSQNLARWIRWFISQGQRAVVVISHNPSFLQQLPISSLWVLSEGRLKGVYPADQIPQDWGLGG